MIQIGLSSAGIILLYFAFLFALACQQRNFAIADIGWGLGFVLTAFYCQYTVANHELLMHVVTGLITLWGLRLTIYLYLRNRKKPEDFRYKKFRDKWARFTNLNAFFKLYIPQAVVMWLVSVGTMIAATSHTNDINLFGWLCVAGAIFGIVYEGVADFQMARFKSNPKNKDKIIQAGLWKLSRHPNYFGEIVFWWSISLLVAASTCNYFALLSGAVLNYLIVFVSGVPMLEAKYEEHPEFKHYKARTNSIVPGKRE